MLARVADFCSFVFEAWRIRPFGRRMLTAVSLITTLSGTMLLLWNPISDLYNDREQERLSVEFESPQLETKFVQGEIAEGEVLTRIVINSIEVDALIVEGTEPDALRTGAGHYIGTPMPCEAGNVAIAGHRTTFGKPFHRLDEVRAGDRIELITPTQRCTYIVREPTPGLKRPTPGSATWITHPNDAPVIGPLPGSFLTLTTCHPKGSAAKRLILRAELETSGPPPGPQQ